MSDRTIPPGARCLDARSTAEKFDKGHSWLWLKLKTDASFPRPLYLAPKSPVWLEHELDQYIARKASA